MSLNRSNPFRPPPGLLRLYKKPDGGHVLITTRPIKPGEIVMVDTPVLVYPSSIDCLHIFCCRCFRVLPSKPLHCLSCYVACFCSDQCRSRSDPCLLCHALPTLVSGTRTWPDDILFLLSAYSLPSIELCQLLLLHSHSSFPDKSIQKLHSELASLVPANNVPMYFTPENTSTLISMKKNNSFALKNPKDPKYESCGVAGARAYGLYFWASMLNHNCIPNVCRFDCVDLPNRGKNTDFVFRAVHEIKEGIEICTSYVDVARGYRERQTRLMEDYGLKCKCGRCKIESQWKENKGEEEESEEKNEGETTERTEEKNKEEETERNIKEGTEEEMEEENEEEIEEETEENNEENKEEEIEEQTEKMNEEESEEKIEEMNKEEEVEVRGDQELEMLEGGDDNFKFLINDYIKRYICDCGGFLAPTPPSQDGKVPDFMECNGCGKFNDYEPGDPLKALYNS